MHGNRGRGFEELAVNGGKDTDEVVGARCRTGDAGVLVNGFQELSNDEGYRLDPLDFLLKGRRHRKGQNQVGGR